MPSLNTLARGAILAAAQNRTTKAFMNRYGMRLGASRFVAGETLDQCVAVIRGLNQQGFKCNATLLGEAVTSAADADRAVAEYRGLIQRLQAEALNCNVAIKLTLMGLDLGEQVAEENMVTLLQFAAQMGMTMRIDMEDSSHVPATLAIYRRLRERGCDNVGAVLQSCLRRSVADLEALLPLAPNLRLVKGAYLESREVAFPEKAEVDRKYLQLIEMALEGAGYTAIATHDQRMIRHSIEFAERKHIDRDRFEFQMLYGIRPQLQRELLQEGYTVLVATCYGTHWYPFFMRRLAERPANVLFLARNLVRR
ncbi:MAG TPA: proline dehydrogenase family protein [Candidatus Acidoferrales bacterium]|nr:proline dehydrogenase family protein [Candidatus Acidoferrales bacterium]HVC38814.1 proline dehydrogenase family protein [Candidatus Dormibacteraeota bacterium]